MLYVKGEYKGKPLNLLCNDNGEIYPQFKKAIYKIKGFKAKKWKVIEEVEFSSEIIDLLYACSKTPITPALAVAEVISDMVKEIEDTFC